LLFNEIPKQIEEKYDLEISYTLKSRKLLHFYNNQNTDSHIKSPIKLQNYAFDLLIKKIPIHNIVKIIGALLLEKKIVLIFNNYQQNAILMQSLLSLLEPLYFYLEK